MKFLPTMRSLKAFAVAAFASAAMFGGSADAQQIDWSYLNSSPVRFESGGVSGNQPGVQRGYYRAGAFLSIIEDSSSLLFLDGHGNVNYDSGNWSGDIGVGYRQDMGGIVLGGNAYYNYREYTNGVTEHNFSTLSFGAEALMADWAVRSNAYFSLNSRESNGLTQFAIPGGPDYVPQVGGSAGVSNIRLATQTENFDESLDIFDLNISRKIPSARSEVGAGVYYMSADGGPDTWGFNGTAETWLTSNVAGNLTVSHDDLFDTTLYGGFSVYFGGPAIDATSRSQSVKSRLWARVQRRNVVPVLNYTTDAPDLLAHNPDTGDLITVAQIGMTGDLLGAPDLLEDDGEFIDIILVDPGATFSPMGTIALNDDQRLLSADIFHDVDTFEFGTIQLPETLLGGGPAILMGAGGVDVITLANSNEVSGFMIMGGAGADGISGTDVNFFNINRNDITAPGGNGVAIDSFGLMNLSGSLVDNMITGSSVDGVNLVGVDVAVDFMDNIITGNGQDNIDIDATGDFSGMIVRNDLSGALGEDGLDLDALTISGAIIDNIANNNGADGFNIVVDNVLAGSTLNITDNTTNLNGDDGISLIFNGDVNSTILVDDNTADSNLGDGISIVSNGMGDILGTISNNTTNGNDPGIFVQTNDAASDLFLDITGNVANNNTEEGILIESAGNFTGLIEGNTTNMNGGVGFVLVADNDILADILNNTASVNDNDGLLIFASNDFTGDINDNTTNLNDGDGIFLQAGNDIVADLLNNTALGNDVDGLHFFASNDLSGDFSGNTASDNLASGIILEAGAVFSGNVSNNTANNNNNDGIELSAGSILSANAGVDGVIDNTANGNGDDGITVGAGTTIGSAMNSFIVSGNTAGMSLITGNGADGISIESQGNAFVTISTNTASNNGSRGVFFNSIAGDITGNITGNTTNNNTNEGIRLTGDDTILDYTGNITGNTAGSNSIGIRIDNTLNFMGDITGNTLALNGTGLSIDVDNNFTGNIGTNTASLNTADGILLFVNNDFTGDIGSNNANVNTGNGFNFTIGNDFIGDIGNNTSSTNGVDGIIMNVTNDFTGDFMNNTASANTGNGFSFTIGNDFIGDIGSNISSANGVDGLFMAVTNDFTGDFMNNTASANTDDGFDTTAGGVVTGTVTPNAAAGNTDMDFTGNIAAP